VQDVGADRDSLWALRQVVCRQAGEHMGSPLQQAGVGFSVVDCADGLVDFSSTVGQV